MNTYFIHRSIIERGILEIARLFSDACTFMRTNNYAPLNSAVNIFCSEIFFHCHHDFNSITCKNIYKKIDTAIERYKI